MFSTPTNEDRAESAHQACDTFARATRMDTAGEELPTIMQDLLTNLMHLADQQEINFENVLRMAVGHYEAEVEEGQDATRSAAAAGDQAAAERNGETDE